MLEQYKSYQRKPKQNITGNIKEALYEVKLLKEGKLKSKTLKEFLKEIYQSP